MNLQIWSGVLTAIGLAGFFLAGRKVWWAWYVNIANQALWMTYAIVTEQWPFIVGAIAYTIVFIDNATKWTKEHFAPPKINEPIGRISKVTVTDEGVLAEGMLYDPRDSPIHGDKKGS